MRLFVFFTSNPLPCDFLILFSHPFHFTFQIMAAIIRHPSCRRNVVIFFLIIAIIIVSQFYLLMVVTPSLITQVGKEDYQEVNLTGISYYIFGNGILTFIIATCCRCGRIFKATILNLAAFCFAAAILSILGPTIDKEYFPLDDGVIITCKMYIFMGIFFLILKRFFQIKTKKRSVIDAANSGDLEFGNRKR